MGRRGLSGPGTLALALLALAAAGCAVTGQPQIAAAPSTVTATVTEQLTTTQTVPTTVDQTVEVTATETAMITTTEVETTTNRETVTVTTSAASSSGPDGYSSFGGGVWAKWSDQGTFECAETSESCWGVDLYTESACPGGVFIGLELFRDDDKLRELDYTTSPMEPGDYLSVVMGQSGSGTGLTASVYEVSCTS